MIHYDSINGYGLSSLFHGGASDFWNDFHLWLGDAIDVAKSRPWTFWLVNCPHKTITQHTHINHSLALEKHTTNYITIFFHVFSAFQLASNYGSFHDAVFIWVDVHLQRHLKGLDVWWLQLFSGLYTAGTFCLTCFGRKFGGWCGSFLDLEVSFFVSQGCGLKKIPRKNTFSNCNILISCWFRTGKWSRRFDYSENETHLYSFWDWKKQSSFDDSQRLRLVLGQCGSSAGWGCFSAWPMPFGSWAVAGLLFKKRVPNRKFLFFDGSNMFYNSFFFFLRIIIPQAKSFCPQDWFDDKPIPICLGTILWYGMAIGYCESVYVCGCIPAEFLGKQISSNSQPYIDLPSVMWAWGSFKGQRLSFKKSLMNPDLIWWCVVICPQQKWVSLTSNCFPVTSVTLNQSELPSVWSHLHCSRTIARTGLP